MVLGPLKYDVTTILTLSSPNCCEFVHNTHTNNTLMCGAKESRNHYQSNHKEQQLQIDLIPSAEQPH